jgi:hypothetical protein
MKEHPHVLTDGTNQPELFFRDIDFLNYNIGHDRYDWLRNYQIADAIRIEDDFTEFTTTQRWTSVLTGGSGSVAVSDAVNGVLVLTTHTDATDAAEVYQTNETFRLYDGHPLYFEARFKVTTGLTDKVYLGIGDANGEYAVGFAHGVYFMSDGDGNLDFKVEDSTVVTSADTGINLADLTWIRVGFHWDGDGTITWFVFDDDQICLATGEVITGFAQDEEMGVAFGVKSPGAGGAVAGYFDYVKCVQRRYVA